METAFYPIPQHLENDAVVVNARFLVKEFDRVTGRLNKMVAIVEVDHHDVEGYRILTDFQMLNRVVSPRDIIGKSFKAAKVFLQSNKSTYQYDPTPRYVTIPIEVLNYIFTGIHAEYAYEYPIEYLSYIEDMCRTRGISDNDSYKLKVRSNAEEEYIKLISEGLLRIKTYVELMEHQYHIRR